MIGLITAAEHSRFREMNKISPIIYYPSSFIIPSKFHTVLSELIGLNYSALSRLLAQKQFNTVEREKDVEEREADRQERERERERKESE